MQITLRRTHLSNNLITFFNSSLFDFISFAPFGHIPYFKSIGGPTQVLRKRPQKVEIRESERSERAGQFLLRPQVGPGRSGTRGKNPHTAFPTPPGAVEMKVCEVCKKYVWEGRGRGSKKPTGAVNWPRIIMKAGTSRPERIEARLR